MNNSIVDLEYFKKQIACSISYQRFLCDYYSNDDRTLSSNISLLSSLYEVKNGVCANPSLILDLIYPSNAKMGKLKSFKSTTNKINNSQYKAVCMALAMNNLMILEGPPGTGKTTVIIELIKQLKLKNNSTRVLITSQSHLAVDNVIKGFVENNEYLDQIARIRQKDYCSYKDYSELSIFKKITESADEKLQRILTSFDNCEDKRFGNEFLKYNVSMVLTNKSIVGVTCNSIPGCHFENGDPFDYVIVDEVGKFSFCELLNVAKIAKKLILIGDPKQLPSVLPDGDKDNNVTFIGMDGFDEKSYSFLKENNYIDDLFNSISNECVTKLNEQYRMSNAIGTYISNTYYNGEVSNGLDKEVNDAINFISYSKFEKIKYNKSLENINNETENSGLVNSFEISIIKELLSEILRSTPKKDIAIITPYRKQANLISESIKDIDKSQISTVDSYQGKEFDYIIFCCTRYFGNSKFIDDWRRINVAVSRAKKKIFVIGCGGYLINNTINIKSLIDFNVLYKHPKSGKTYTFKCKKWIVENNKIIELNKKQTNYRTNRTNS